MNPRATLFSLFLTLAPLGQGAMAEEAPSTATPPGKVQRWADRCTDFTTNGWAFKAPNNFLAWLDVFSDPGIWLEFGKRGLDPQSYVRSANSLLEPAMVKNYLEWTDPVIYEKWAAALADPQFITSVNTTLFDPGRMMRWAMLPLDSKAWDLLLATANPETWLKWLTTPSDPQVQGLYNRLLDPKTAQDLWQALQDPANYPGMLYPEPASTTMDARPRT